MARGLLLALRAEERAGGRRRGGAQTPIPLMEKASVRQMRPPGQGDTRL